MHSFFLQGKADQEAVQRFLAAIESLDAMIAPQLLDAERHLLRRLLLEHAGFGQKPLEPRQGPGRRIERSQKRLPARRVESKMLTIGQRLQSASSALSSTNSLTERREACAAAFSTRFASGVRRKSSFSDLVALAMMTSPGALSSTSGLLCHDIVWRIFLVKAPAPICARAATTPIHPGRRPSPRGRAGSRSLAAKAPA